MTLPPAEVHQIEDAPARVVRWHWILAAVVVAVIYRRV